MNSRNFKIDEQRQNQYLNLVRQMALCSNDEQKVESLLKDNESLIDAGLIKTLDQLAAMHLAQGNQEFAEIVRDLANEFTLHLYGQLKAELDAYSQLISEMLNAVSENQDNPQLMDSILEANAEKLNENFIVALQIFRRKFLYKVKSENAPDIAALIHDLGKLIAEFPRGIRAHNIEISIACCEEALIFLTREKYPRHWQRIHNSLGNFYAERMRGNRAENLELSIEYIKISLSACNRHDFPKDWASCQANLGNIYLERIKGEYAENIETAIRCYQAALSVLTPQEHLFEWIAVENSLGSAYIKRIRGNRHENIELSIICFNAALQACSFQKDPIQWSMIHNNLGNSYRYRIEGNYILNLEQAIYHYESSLKVRTREHFSRDWAATISNLAGIYHLRFYGKRADNLEQAITYYQVALSVYTYEDYPERWADIQHHLGTVYCHRINGDLVENFEVAIQAFTAALSIHTRENYPEKWAQLQADLGIAYYHQENCKIVQKSLGLSNNIERAIECYQAALSVITPEAYPEKWAAIQLNLGVAYQKKKLGEEAENLVDSIAAYHAALQVYTRDKFPLDWAMVCQNLAVLYCQKINKAAPDSLQLALQYAQATLDVYTLEAFPEFWAKVQITLAEIARQLGQIEQAIFHCRSALKVLTPTHFPLNCFLVGLMLGQLAFDATKWTEAIEGYTIGMKGLEISRAWLRTDTRRQEIMEKAFNANMNLVRACMNIGKIELAFESVERFRSRRLVDVMASNNLYLKAEMAPQLQDYLQQYESLQRQIDVEHLRKDLEPTQAFSKSMNDLNQLLTEPQQTRASWQAYNETVQRLETEKQKIFEHLRRLDPILASQVQLTCPDLAAVQKLIDYRTTAILSFYSTNTDTYIFVVRQDRITCHICPEQGLETLHDRGILDNWLTPYVAFCNSTKNQQTKIAWMDNMSHYLTILSHQLKLDELVTKHLLEIEELIVIPYLNVHSIPLAALPLQNSQYLGDKFLIRYVPSCQILEFCQKRSHPENFLEKTCGIVEDSRENLPFAIFECAQIAQLYQVPNSLHLKGRSQATINNYKKLAEQVHILHSSHHAQSRIDNPLESKLELADGYITLGQLMTPGWRFSNLVDVFLSCCETGFGIIPITDDALTLTTGFLCAGASSVTNTLWSVEDLPTALFSIFYHQHRTQGACRIVALQLAQIELRTLSCQTLLSVYQPQIEEIFDIKFKQFNQASKTAKVSRDEFAQDTPEYLKWDKQYKQLLLAADKARRQKLTVQKTIHAASQKPFPFDHPFYWAAFSCSGLR